MAYLRPRDFKSLVSTNFTIRALAGAEIRSALLQFAVLRLILGDQLG